MRRTFLAILGILILAVALVLPAHAQTDTYCTRGIFAIYWIDTNFCRMTIDLAEVRQVLPPDAIRSIDAPLMNSIEEAETWLAELSPVIAIEINGDARAYPLAILVFHEIANDVIGEVPVAVTYCPLCNSSIVFERTISDDILDFAVSGNLRNSDLIMYDRQTESWWQQFTGEGIVGDFAGILLEIVPSQVIGFGQFKELYPEGQVLEPAVDAPYGQISASYANYDIPFLYDGVYDERLPATAHVLATHIDDLAIAYPFSALSEEIVVNDTINDEQVVIFWQSGMVAMMDAQIIDNSRDIGTANLYDRRLDDGTILTFSYDTASGSIIDEQSGSVWTAFGLAIDGELEGTQLAQRIAAPHFWFAWVAFNDDTRIYGIE